MTPPNPGSLHRHGIMRARFDRELASAIWTTSGKTVNPRHTYGHWLLSQKYGLVEEGSAGNLVLADRGRDFIDNEGGETEAFLDEQEGLAKLLALVADNGPSRAGGILEEWTEYLNRHSAFASPSTFRDTLRRRLNNLLDRGFVSRKSTMYSVTDAGLAYLKRVGTEEALGGDEQQELWSLAKKQEASVRESMRELLLDMDAFAFEHLVKRLLEEMDYQNVEVTTRSGDGGVDVIAEIELGITSVREVVQAKRHRRTIQRKDLDALRGSLSLQRRPGHHHLDLAILEGHRGSRLRRRRRADHAHRRRQAHRSTDRARHRRPQAHPRGARGRSRRVR